jgi:hypothetical protein
MDVIIQYYNSNHHAQTEHNSFFTGKLGTILTVKANQVTSTRSAQLLKANKFKAYVYYAFHKLAQKYGKDELTVNNTCNTTRHRASKY